MIFELLVSCNNNTTLVILESDAPVKSYDCPKTETNYLRKKFKVKIYHADE